MSTIEGITLVGLLGGAAAILLPVLTIVGVFLTTKTPDQMGQVFAASSGEMGVDWETANWMSGLFSGKTVKERWHEEDVAKIETQIKAGYVGKDVYFFNFGFWWTGTITDIEFVTEPSLTTTRTVIQMWGPAKEVETAEDVLAFHIDYHLNRGVTLHQVVKDPARLWLKDDRGEPDSYVFPYTLDTYLSENDGEEDAWSLGLTSYNQPTKFEMPEIVEVEDPVETPIVDPDPVVIPPDSDVDIPDVVVIPPDSDVDIPDVVVIPPVIDDSPKKESEPKIYPVAPYRNIPEYTSFTKRELQYAFGSSFIIVLISLL